MKRILCLDAFLWTHQTRFSLFCSMNGVWMLDGLDGSHVRVPDDLKVFIDVQNVLSWSNLSGPESGWVTG